MTYKDIVVLIPSHSLEDFPTELGEEAAASLLNAFAVTWHPQLLATAGVIPRWKRADEMTDSQPDRLVIVPKPCEDLVPSTWVERARSAGANVIFGISERQQMLADALEPLPELKTKLDESLVADFLALGTVYLMTELLTRHMRNFSHLDQVAMEREGLAAARAALANDREAAEKHLGHCFEMLLECRERFYPVDCYLIDLCLVMPKLVDEQFQALLSDKASMNLMAPAEDWELIAQEHPQLIDTIRNRWRGGGVDLIGGELQETATPLISLDSNLWQLRQGRHVLKTLFERAPTVWGRKRFGVHAQLPQLLSRLGYLSALHFVMDDGIYPDEEQSKLKWEGSDGTILDTFSRIPLAGDSASAFLRLPMRIAESMDYDHTAAVCFARWTQLKTPWLNDLRRAFRYSPVLGKFTTFEEFFQYSDAPGRNTDCKANGYFTPFLVHAVARQEADPIGRYVDYWSLRRRFERAAWSRAVTALMKHPHLEADQTEPLEAVIERAHPYAEDAAKREASDSLLASEQMARDELVRMLAARGSAGEGMLIVNQHSFGRTVPVSWPEGLEPVKEGPVSHVQIDDTRAVGLIDVPPCGFVWVKSRPRSGEIIPNVKPPMAEGLNLRNDFFEVQLSEVTGGIGKIRTYRRSPNRLSHQLAYRFPHERTITTGGEGQVETYKSYYSEMVLSESRVLSAGPVLGEIETVGGIVDQQNKRVLADYVQRVKVWRNKPFIEVDIELDPKRLPEGDPWTNYYCCRFAWKDSSMALTGSLQQGAQALKGPRIESPHFLEIADEGHRTTILTGGLTFHRKTGDRMLDSLLLVEGESKRKFSFAVAIDHDFPMEAALDQYSPPLVIPTDSSPESPRGGWLFQVSVRNVQLSRILPLETIEHDAPAKRQGYVVRLLETEGRRKKFDLRCFRAPVSARQCDFTGKTIGTLKVTDDTVHCDIAPYEVCDVELLYQSDV